MKTQEKKIYSPKKLFLVIIFTLVFLFIGLKDISYASTNDPVSGTLSVSPTTVHIGEPITISITGRDNNGLVQFEIYDQDHCLYREKVSGISATRTLTITEDSPATYKYYGRVFGVDSDPSTWTGWLWGETESGPTSPEYIDVAVLDSTSSIPSSCTDECSYSGQTRCYNSSRKQICGQYDSDSCLEWSSTTLCSGNTSCGYGTCDDDERPDWRCSGGNCTYGCDYDSSCVSSSECSEGPCCDGNNYRPSTQICDFETQTQYGCPWGLGCGADTAQRTKTRFKYCSGDNSQCTGSWHNWLSWTAWRISDYCSSNEICTVGSSQCQYSSSCVQPEAAYIKKYEKDCYDNALYWFDSNGEKQDKEQECSDDDPCTMDGCENSACFNTLKCDGVTCEVSSSEYCESCEHCGDNICNCQENNDTCSKDCPQGLEKGKAALGLTLKSLLKKWYIWLLLGIAAILLLYWLFKRPKEG